MQQSDEQARRCARGVSFEPEVVPGGRGRENLWESEALGREQHRSCFSGAGQVARRRERAKLVLAMLERVAGKGGRRLFAGLGGTDREVDSGGLGRHHPAGNSARRIIAASARCSPAL